MTGTHTQNPVYSRLTLALMEDSGWYKANYSVAEPLHWGNNLGCDFAMKSCGQWIKQRMERFSKFFKYFLKYETKKEFETKCEISRSQIFVISLTSNFENFLNYKNL